MFSLFVFFPCYLAPSGDFGWEVDVVVHIILWETGAELQLPIERVVYLNMQTCQLVGLPKPPTIQLTSVLAFMRRRKIDLALLQETHLLSRDSGRMANRFYHTIASSSAESKSKGVAIVCKRSLKIKMLDVWADAAGRIVVAKVELYGRKAIAIVSASAPNNLTRSFMTHSHRKCSNWLNVPS